MLKIKIIISSIFVFFFYSSAQALEFKGKFIQGHYIIGKTEPGSLILVDKKKLKSQRMVILLLGLKKIGNLTLQLLKIITRL